MQQRKGALELGLTVATLAALGRFVSDVPLWVVTVLAVVVAVAGTAGILGETRPWRWPLDRVVLPGVAAFASVGTARLLDPVPWVAFVFAGAWLVVTWAVRVEMPTVAGDETPDAASAEAASEAPAGASDASSDAPHARPTSARLGGFGLAFLGFAAIGGIVPGGVAGDGHPLTVAAFLATVALDVAIGGLSGYRIAALRPHKRGYAAVALYQYSMILAPAGVLVRVLALPRLFGPAVLTLVSYLVTSLRESGEPVRSNRRLIEETAVLTAAGLAMVALGVVVK
jgi:hypothetical protein